MTDFVSMMTKKTKFPANNDYGSNFFDQMAAFKMATSTLSNPLAFLSVNNICGPLWTEIS